MIFLDYQSTSPLDPRVLEKMQPYMTRWFGNPHSEHIFGWKSAEATDKAREEVASMIGAEPPEILFTSGATESNNLAIQGILRNNKSEPKHFVTTSIEEI